MTYFNLYAKEKLMASRKDKPVGQIFGAGLSWAEAIDAVADVYNGVSCLSCWRTTDLLIESPVRFLVHAHIAWVDCLVYVAGESFPLLSILPRC